MILGKNMLFWNQVMIYFNIIGTLVCLSYWEYNVYASFDDFVLPSDKSFMITYDSLTAAMILSLIILFSNLLLKVTKTI